MLLLNLFPLLLTLLPCHSSCVCGSRTQSRGATLLCLPFALAARPLWYLLPPGGPQSPGLSLLGSPWSSLSADNFTISCTENNGYETVGLSRLPARPCSCPRALGSDSLRVPAPPFPRDLALLAVCSLQVLFFLSLLISVSSRSGFSYSNFQNSFKAVSKYPPTASVLHSQTWKRLCIHWHLFS